MRITIDGNVVEFTPETQQETAQMDNLWRVMVSCTKDNKKMVPIGEYTPIKENLARFVIEDIKDGGA